MPALLIRLDQTLKDCVEQEATRQRLSIADYFRQLAIRDLEAKGIATDEPVSAGTDD